MRAKQRSVHNNYLTLPVVSSRCWPATSRRSARTRLAVLLAIFAIVAAIRHFFNRWHTGRREWWILGAAAAAAVALGLRAGAGRRRRDRCARRRGRAEHRHRAVRRATRAFLAPNGVRLESLAQMEQHADAIELQVSSRAMPPGNATGPPTRSARNWSPGPRPAVGPGVLEITAAGMRFVARWEDELAPQTVAAFKAILLLDDRIIHCRWSGESN